MGTRVVDAELSGAAVTALPVAVARDLPLEKRGEFRVASGAVIKMKPTDESGDSRTHHGSCQTSAERYEGLQEMGLSSLRGRRNPFGTKFSCCLRGLNNFEKKHKVWNRHYREGNLYNAYVRAGVVRSEPAPVDPAKESWTRIEVDDGDRDEQGRSGST